MSDDDGPPAFFEFPPTDIADVAQNGIDDTAELRTVVLSGPSGGRLFSRAGVAVVTSATGVLLAVLTVHWAHAGDRSHRAISGRSQRSRGHSRLVATSHNPHRQAVCHGASHLQLRRTERRRLLRRSVLPGTRVTRSTLSATHFLPGRATSTRAADEISRPASSSSSVHVRSQFSYLGR
jgi:hypothetical protein